MSTSESLVDECLVDVWEQGGTDLILTVDSPPLMRLDGQVRRLHRKPVNPVMLQATLTTLLTAGQAGAYAADHQVDFAFTWRDVARVRGNAFQQRGAPALALRVLPLTIPSMATLGLPATAQAWTAMPRGLVLVAGPTGSGKSTTLAAMLDQINATQARHIVTIEDPIEYFHDHRLGVVSQREVGVDTHSFEDGLRAVLREDPDVVLIGEMRDPASIQAALSIAETGHLVFSTLHTNDTGQALDRIIDVFPTDRQPQIRLQLAHTLTGILHQLLVRRLDGGRLAAFEVLVGNQAVRNLIREGKTKQIRNVVATGQREGMQTLESALSDMLRHGVISREEALAHSLYPNEVTG